MFQTLFYKYYYVILLSSRGKRQCLLKYCPKITFPKMVVGKQCTFHISFFVHTLLIAYKKYLDLF